MADLWGNARFRLLLIISGVMLLVMVASGYFILQRSGGFAPINGTIVYLNNQNLFEVGTAEDALPNQISEAAVRDVIVSENDSTLFFILEENFGIRRRIGANPNILELNLCNVTAERCDYLLPSEDLQTFVVGNENLSTGERRIQFFGGTGGRQFTFALRSDGDVDWLNDEVFIYRHIDTNNLRVFELFPPNDIIFDLPVIPDNWVLTPDKQNVLIINADTLQPQLISLNFENGTVIGRLDMPIPYDGVTDYSLGAAIWHPNNTHIVLTRNQTDLVYVEPFEPAQARTLITNFECPITAEDWHPSGRFLLYTLDCASGSQIRIYDMQTGNNRYVGIGTQPRWINTN